VSLLIKLWEEIGYSIVLFCDEPSHSDDYEIPSNVPRIVLPPINGGPERVQERLRKLMKSVCDEQIGIFVHNTVMAHPFIFDLLALKALGVRCLAINHGTFATSLVAQDDQFTWAAHVLRLLDDHIVLSRSELSYWSLCGVKARYIPNPVPWNIWDIREASLKAKNVVWIGRLSFEKRSYDALDMFARVAKRDRDARFFFVGAGETPESVRELRRRVAELDLEDRVVVCGYQTDVSTFYEIASVVVITSQLESFSMALLESKAHGVPVVIYNMPNLELVADGFGVVTVDHRDIAGGAQAIISLLADFDYRKRLGDEGRRGAEALLKENDLKGAWRDVFEGVAPPEDVGDDPAARDIKRSFKTNLETIYYTYRAGLEWRDAHFVARWMVANATPEQKGASAETQTSLSEERLQYLMRRLGRSRLQRLFELASATVSGTWRGKIAPPLSPGEMFIRRIRRGQRLLRGMIVYGGAVTIALSALLVWGGFLKWPR
jgi:glycosyltransferase involved in cell wall biosynthesis